MGKGILRERILKAVKDAIEEDRKIMREIGSGYRVTSLRNKKVKWKEKK